MSRPIATAEILAIGSELLTPLRADTHSAYLTARLNALGIDVRARAVIGDARASIADWVRRALATSDLALLTGGLGPTADDVTRDGVADALDLPLDEAPELVTALAERFARRGVAMPDINRRQAQVPRGATVLPNALGTAPGLWIERGGRVVVLLPGPPRELHRMFEAEVEPRLASRAAGRQVRRRVLKIAGRTESAVDEVAAPIYGAFSQWPEPIDTTILAARGQIELHLSARGEQIARVDDALARGVAALAAALGSAVFSTDGRTLGEVVGGLLHERQWTIATAESCTAGMLAARLTDVPGASAWVRGGVVAYANDVKTAELDVPASLIASHGAVSEPVAAAMATGVARRLHADVGVGITGIAGPSGGTPEKPVGTVVVAVSVREAPPAVRTWRFTGDRDTIRRLSVQSALDMTRHALLEHL